MAHLAQVPSPVGVFPQFFARGSETLVLKEKVLSLTGDDFHIKLANGTPILRVEGKVMSISGRKKVFDEQGNHLFDIVKEHFHIHTTFRVEDAQERKIMEVKSSFKLMGSKATATFTSQSGKQEVLTMRGNWFDTTADITDEAQGNAVVARIDRKLLSGKDIFFGQQTYAVTVAPGVDMALIAALCICLDEKNNEGGSQNVKFLAASTIAGTEKVARKVDERTSDEARAKRVEKRRQRAESRARRRLANVEHKRRVAAVKERNKRLKKENPGQYYQEMLERLEFEQAKLEELRARQELKTELRKIARCAKRRVKRRLKGKISTKSGSLPRVSCRESRMRENGQVAASKADVEVTEREVL